MSYRDIKVELEYDLSEYDLYIKFKDQMCGSLLFSQLFEYHLTTLKHLIYLCLPTENYETKHYRIRMRLS
jgi:hypothetical protein